MKDSVKITVIATGFKESEMRTRRPEGYEPVIVPRQRDHFYTPDPEPVAEPEPRFEPDPKPLIMQDSAPSATGSPSHAEVIPMETIHTPPPVYQAEDLDVPAFLRKRNDVM